jgi:hypothetical protein
MKSCIKLKKKEQLKNLWTKFKVNNQKRLIKCINEKFSKERKIKI